MVALICNGIGQVNSGFFSDQFGRPNPLEGIARKSFLPKRPVMLTDVEDFVVRRFRLYT
jgi:hypothetical protein